MSDKEIKDFLEKPEVIEFLKKTIKINLDCEECENIYGYDIHSEVYLFCNLLAEDEDSI